METSTSTPLLGRAKTLPKRTPPTTIGKVKGKGNGNGNIMSFFKRTESAGTSGAIKKAEEESLFVEDVLAEAGEEVPTQMPTPPRDETFLDEVDFIKEESPTLRYNEDFVPFKRRKVEAPMVATSEPLVHQAPASGTKGPFADDSDSDEDEPATPEILKQTRGYETIEEERRGSTTTPPSDRMLVAKENDDNVVPAPQLKREATSIGEVNEFDSLDDFIDDEFVEDGEEFMERRWMEEQAELELGLEDDDPSTASRAAEISEDAGESAAITPDNAGSASCPICGGNTAGLVEQVSGSTRCSSLS